jgi:hypothetical protein
MEIHYEQEELEILEACLDIALIQLEEKKNFFGNIAVDLERDINRAGELKNRIRSLINIEAGRFIVFTRYEIFLLIEIICDVLNYYKEEEYPKDTISRIMVAKKPLFDSIIAKQSPSLFLSRKEKKKAS